MHIAVTVQAHADVLSILANHEPAAVRARDCYNLTPVDWLWISHVREARQASTGHRRTPSSRVARRRYLASDFLDWHEQLSASSADFLLDEVNEARVGNRRDFQRACARQNGHLLSCMKVLMPAATSLFYDNDDAPSWNWLHATFAVPCPRAMRELALRELLQDDGPPELSKIIDPFRLCDPVHGRTLLHHAVAAVGPYTAVLPVGISRGIKLLRECSQFWTVQRVANRVACTLVDNAGQLPLHVAIDAFKEYRRAQTSSKTANTSANSLLLLRKRATTSPDEGTDEDKILSLLLLHKPSVLEQRDSKTNLYPWMQAAVGECARLTTIYNLFRRYPNSVICDMRSC